MKTNRFFLPRTAASAQRGVVLFIALIVLVAMSLAGIGLMRSVGNGVIVAGNIGMKAATTAAAEHGIAGAKAVINGYTAVARTNDIGRSYFASFDPAFDPVTAGAAWWLANGALVAVNGTPYAGMDIRYVVHRLCEVSGPIDNGCVRMGDVQEQGGGCVQGGRPIICKVVGFAGYLITTRVVGPKNSVSYVQTVVF